MICFTKQDMIEMSDIDTAINRTYSLITKNFIRIGIFLFVLGLILMILGVFIQTSNSIDVKTTIAGGAFFVSGTLFTISSTFVKR